MEAADVVLEGEIVAVELVVVSFYVLDLFDERVDAGLLLQCVALNDPTRLLDHLVRVSA